MKRPAERSDNGSSQQTRDVESMVAGDADSPATKKCKLGILAQIAELSTDSGAKHSARNSSGDENDSANTEPSERKVVAKKKSSKATLPVTAASLKKGMKNSSSVKKALEKKSGGANGKKAKTPNGGSIELHVSGPNKTSNFPVKIMELLENGLATDAIWWVPGEDTIAVEPDNFAKSKIVENYFGENKIAAFIKNLNKWGFKQVSNSSEHTLKFSHSQFQRKASHLVKKIKKENSSTSKKSSVPASIPEEVVHKIPPSTPKDTIMQKIVERRQPVSPLGEKPKADPPGAAETRSALLQTPDEQRSALAQSILAQQQQRSMDASSLLGSLTSSGNSILNSILTGQQLELQQQQAQQQAQQAQQQALMQTLLAEQRLAALNQINSQDTIMQALLAEEQRKQALMALNPTEVLLRERLLQASTYAQPQQLGLQQLLGQPSGGSVLDQLALLQAGQQPRDNNAALLEQLMLMQQQRGL